MSNSASGLPQSPTPCPTGDCSNSKISSQPTSPHSESTTESTTAGSAEPQKKGHKRGQKLSAMDSSWMMVKRPKEEADWDTDDVETMSVGTDAADSCVSSSTTGTSGQENNVTGGKSKLHLKCMNCELAVKNRTDFLWLPEHEDWCGKLWGHCLECSGLGKKDFKRKQNKLWNQRATILYQKQERVRTLNWKNLDAALKEKYPGVSNKDGVSSFYFLY